MTNKEKTEKKKHPVLKAILIFALCVTLCGCAFVGFTVSAAPTLDDASATPDGYLTTVLDDEGNLMITLAGAEANRVYVTLDQIPEHLQKAFIAIEDERFYTHSGIDLVGISRAAFKGISDREFSQGASTITQQLIKNNVLTSWTEEETFYDKVQRKIQEQYLALILERRESKEWILENYLNTINLGGGTWGVQAASRRYFGKSVADLTLSECAVLAAIPKSPSAYDPLKHPEANEGRMGLVLGLMVSQGYITQEECDAALADDVYTRIAEAHTDPSAQTLSYFEDALVQSVVDDLTEQLGYSADEAWDLVYRGGLTIYTTQNTDLQTICEEEVNNDSLFSSDQQVSVVVMDAGNGAVKAIVGGRGDKNASLIYNRAIESVRQPGSTIKPIGEYAAALENGTLTLGTAVADEPYTYSDGTDIQNAAGTYPGMTTIRDAIASSSNIVALKAFQSAGMDTVLSCLRGFGISTLTDDDRHEALAIGGTYNGVTNLELTAAYNTINAGGAYTKPYYYTQVVDHDGRTILSNEPSYTQVISPQTAFLLTSGMMSVFDYGTGVEAGFDGLPIAGKTGTSSDARDTWIVGYCPYFTCGIWGGYDDNSSQYSTGYVKTLWKQIMRRATADYKYCDFEQPSGITTATICTKCGKLAIAGLCDHTVQGDMTRTEYFAQGTAPTARCDCHEAVRVCTESGKIANRHCPADSVEERVYLKTAIPGTLDEAYVVPSQTAEVCDTHTSIWDGLFGNDQGGGLFDGIPEPDTAPEEEYEEGPSGSGESDAPWYAPFIGGDDTAGNDSIFPWW